MWLEFSFVKGTDRSYSTPSAAVENEWSYTCTSPTSLHDVDRDRFTYRLQLCYSNENQNMFTKQFV